MFKSIFGKKKQPEIRHLDSANDLRAGDIIKFKQRSVLPESVQGEEFEVTAVGTYQYPGMLSKELTLRNSENRVIYMAIEEDDGESELILSLKIPRNLVLTLFDEEQFSQLWEDDFPELQVLKFPDELKGWLAPTYQQDVKEAEAYYYRGDRTHNPPGRYQDDEAEELRYHECSGDHSALGLSVEIWEDGSTDVALQVSLPMDVIAEFWPGSSDE